MIRYYLIGLVRYMLDIHLWVFVFVCNWNFQVDITKYSIVAGCKLVKYMQCNRFNGVHWKVLLLLFQIVLKLPQNVHFYILPTFCSHNFIGLNKHYNFDKICVSILLWSMLVPSIVNLRMIADFSTITNIITVRRWMWTSREVNWSREKVTIQV